MANHKSAKKRSHQILKRTFVNKAHLTRARTAIRTLKETVSKGDQSAIGAQLRRVQSLLAKTSLSRQTIARKTSRLTRFASK